MSEPIAGVGYLAGLCGHNGTDWLKVKTDANGYLYVVGTGTTGAMEVTQDTPGDLLVGQHQYDGSAWRKSNLLLGYNDRWVERISDLNASAGDNTLYGVAVPSGYVYVLQAINGQNNVTDPSSIHMKVVGGAISITLAYKATPGIAVPATWSGELILKEGDKAGALLRGCAAGDDLYVTLWGYKMKLDM